MEPQAAAPAQTPAPAQSLVPDSWPGAFGIFKTAKQATMINVWAIIGIGLISLVLSAVFSRTPLVVRLVGEVISIFLAIGTTLLYLASAKGEKLSVGDALSQSGSFFFNYLLLSILSGFIIGLSFLLFIIPFFFVFPRLTLATYYLIDKKLGPVDALKASWNGTKGHVGKVWGIIAVTFLFAILCIVLVGIYFIIMYSSVTALLYFFIQRHTSPPKAAVAPVTPSADSNQNPPATPPLA